VANLSTTSGRSIASCTHQALRTTCLLTKLYESGFRYLPAKSGPKGHETRFWRKPEGESPGMSLGDLDSFDDDLRGLLGDDG
jgi:hypothetical protein